MKVLLANLRFLVVLVVVSALGGCVSPLKSDDPATRVAAVSKISDEKELFLVAMNVGVEIGFTHGSYTEIHYICRKRRRYA